MSKKNIILCFCKHPIPGLVKSRLAKDIGNNQAAEIYKLLLEETLNSISKLEFKVFLYCYPDTKHPVFKEYKTKFGVELNKQHGENLGSKMFHAINEHLNENNNVVLIGSDCIEINARYLKKAFDELNSGCEIVIGPTADGGYALIGAKKIDASLFQNITWSTNQVFNQTEKIINELGWKYSCLSKVRDLDTLDDFQFFSTHKKYQYFFKRLSSLIH